MGSVLQIIALAILFAIVIVVGLAFLVYIWMLSLVMNGKRNPRNAKRSGQNW